MKRRSRDIKIALAGIIWIALLWFLNFIEVVHIPNWVIWFPLLVLGGIMMFILLFFCFYGNFYVMGIKINFVAVYKLIKKLIKKKPVSSEEIYKDLQAENPKKRKVVSTVFQNRKDK
jgi:hypothetical protein